MLRLRQAAALIGCAATLAGCTTATTHTPPSASVRSASSPALTPSVPTGKSNCGSDLVTATTVNGTVALDTCAGLAGLDPLPSVMVKVGGEVLISGVPTRARLTARPAASVRLTGSTFVAERAGRIIVTVHNYDCVGRGTVQPLSCDLLTIVVS